MSESGAHDPHTRSASAEVFPGVARGRCPERPSKPSAARPSRREGSTPSPLRDRFPTTGTESSGEDPDRALGGARPARGHPLTFGTAGHVDHGKTALVAALTGVDTDRLPEEKTRGLSIVLGYAPLALPSGQLVSIVDVPGHERFVRTMVAGASGIDAFLMVVAADDGVMPQTREHADVLRGLGVQRGVLAVTKADLADPSRARREVEALMPGCPIVVCSTHTGAGMEQLSWALDALAGSLRSRADTEQGTRLHIDRAFTVKGRGTVVTGTLWSGAIAVGDELALVPGGARIRVRSVQVHDVDVREARAGQRVAVNLRGTRREEVARGDLLADPSLVQSALVAERRVLDCCLELRSARHGERVQVHHGTRDVPGRLCEKGQGMWQLRLERPLLACDGDRLIVRRQAPPETLGGGTIVNAAARRRVRPDRQPAEDMRTAARETRAEIPERLLAEIEQRLREAGTALISEAALGEHTGSSVSALQALRDEGLAVRVSGRLYAHAAAVAEARGRICSAIERNGALSLAQARDVLGVGRKATQAFLEHFDGLRVTRRLPDDRRVLAR